MASQADCWKSFKGSFQIISARGFTLACHADIQDPTTPNAVVLCHGLFSSKNYALIRKLADNLSNNSISIDLHGNGESEGDNEWAFGGYLDDTCHDIRPLIQHLRKQGIAVQALVGHSRGANSVLLYAAEFDDIPVVVSLAARFHMERGLAKRFNGEQMRKLEAGGDFEMKSFDGRIRIITSKSVQERKDLDMKAYLSKAKNTKFLFIHGTMDTVIDETDARELAQCVTGARVKIIGGASHSLCDTDKVVAQVVGEIEEMLV